MTESEANRDALHFFQTSKKHKLDNQIGRGSCNISNSIEQFRCFLFVKFSKTISKNYKGIL